jgi:hypothetical protein
MFLTFGYVEIKRNRSEWRNMIYCVIYNDSLCVTPSRSGLEFIPIAPRSLYKPCRHILFSNAAQHAYAVLRPVPVFQLAPIRVFSPHLFHHTGIIAAYLLPKSLACKFLVILGSLTTKPSSSLLMHT